MKIYRFFPLFTLIILLAACKQGLKPDSLYGEWKYVKIDHPKGDALSDTSGAEELASHQAHIKFNSDNTLQIWWDGKVLSHGTFVTEGDNIQFTEQLAEGGKRTFPFWVSRIDAKNLVFETLGADGSRVAAVKQ